MAVSKGEAIQEQLMGNTPYPQIFTFTNDGRLRVDAISSTGSEAILNETYFIGYVWDTSTSQFVKVEGYISNIQYTYDANNNLTGETLTITDVNGTTTYTISRTYGYDANNNLISKSRWEM